MTYKYKCSKCRTRHTFSRQVHDYIREKKCNACGHKHFYWVNEHNGRRDICGCDGYHYTHRRGCRHCHHSPLFEYNLRVYRHGEEALDVFIDMTLANRYPTHQPEEPPF